MLRVEVKNKTNEIKVQNQVNTWNKQEQTASGKKS